MIDAKFVGRAAEVSHKPQIEEPQRWPTVNPSYMDINQDNQKRHESKRGLGGHLVQASC